MDTKFVRKVILAVCRQCLSPEGTVRTSSKAASMREVASCACAGCKQLLSSWHPAWHTISSPSWSCCTACMLQPTGSACSYCSASMSWLLCLLNPLPWTGVTQAVRGKQSSSTSAASVTNSGRERTGSGAAVQAACRTWQTASVIAQ